MTSKGALTTIKAIGSTVTEKDMETLRKKHPGFTFRKPAAGETKASAREGELCVYLRHLRDGLGLPITECLKVFFREFALVPAQLTPNSIANLTGLWRYLDCMGVAWTIPNILSLLTVASVERGVYYMLPRDPTRLSLSGTPNAVHSWKEKFVFVSCTEGWGIGTEGQLPSVEIFRGWKETEEIKKFYLDMDCAHFDLDVRTLKVRTSAVPVQKGTKAGGGPSALRKRASEDEGAEGASDAVPKRRRMPPRGAKQTRASASLEVERIGSTGESEEEERDEEEESGRVADSGSHSAAKKTGDAAETPAGEELGQNEAEDAATGGVKETFERLPECWLDEERQICCYRFDRERSLLPRFDPSTLPTRMVAPLLATVDRDYLDTLSDKVVARAHAQMLVGGAIIGKYMAVKSEERRREGVNWEKMEPVLTAKVKALEKVVSEAEAKTALDKGTFVCREFELLERLGFVDRKEKEAREEAEAAKKLNEELKAEVAKMKEAEEKAARHRLFIDREVEQLREAATSFVPTLEEAKEVYEKSEAYKEAMGDFGEYGFELLKKALLKDQVGDPAVVSGYDYWDCIGRSADGQL